MCANGECRIENGRIPLALGLRREAFSRRQNLPAETRKIRPHRTKTSFIGDNRVLESWQIAKESWFIVDNHGKNKESFFPSEILNRRKQRLNPTQSN
jgi:hypothetical protein